MLLTRAQVVTMFGLVTGHSVHAHAEVVGEDNYDGIILEVHEPAYEEVGDRLYQVNGSVVHRYRLAPSGGSTYSGAVAASEPETAEEPASTT